MRNTHMRRMQNAHGVGGAIGEGTSHLQHTHLGAIYQATEPRHEPTNHMHQTHIRMQGNVC